VKLSGPSIRRLCGILSLMDEMEEKGIKTMSSAEMGLRLGAKADTIRKDISYLGEIGPSPRGVSGR